jgi:hypothetical protein
MCASRQTSQGVKEHHNAPPQCFVVRHAASLSPASPCRAADVRRRRAPPLFLTVMLLLLLLLLLLR